MPKIEIEYKYSVGSIVYYIDTFFSQVHNAYLKMPSSARVKKIFFTYQSNEPIRLNYHLDNDKIFYEEKLFDSWFACRDFIDGK